MMQLEPLAGRHTAVRKSLTTPIFVLQEMVCVEAAVAPSGPVVVPPGQDKAWTATQTLLYQPTS